MKKIFFLLFLSPALYFAKAQDRIPSPKIAVKWSPGSVFLGNVGLQAEYNFGKNSLTANLGIPVNKDHTFKYDDKDAVFSMKAITFLAGYRTYLSKKHMQGLYLEPFFKYVHHMSEGLGTAFMHNETVLMNFTNDYNG